MISYLQKTKHCFELLILKFCFVCLFHSTMWIRKSIILLNLVVILTALPTTKSNCPKKCNCKADGTIVRCPGNTTLKDWQRIGSTISKNAIQLEILFADFNYLIVSCFEKLPKLTALRIFGGRLKAFPKGLPGRFPELKFLLIRGTEIKSVPSSVFKDFQHLVNLNLGDNKITRLSKDNFKNLVNLKVLNLESNEINCIDRDSFVGLKSLLIVTMDSNKLVRLPSGVFDPLRRQIFLIFSNNKICEIQKGLFKAFHKIALIDLKNNAIAKIEDGAFESLLPVMGGLGINLSNNPVLCSGKLSPDLSKVKLLVSATCPVRPRTPPPPPPPGDLQEVVNSN